MGETGLLGAGLLGGRGKPEQGDTSIVVNLVLPGPRFQKPLPA